MTAELAAEVERYLRTGETDPHHAAWPGNGFMERANRAHDDLRGALVREVHRLAEGLAHEPLPQAGGVVATSAESSVDSDFPPPLRVEHGLRQPSTTGMNKLAIRAVAIARSQALIDVGLPEHLHAAWADLAATLAPLDAFDRILLLSFVDKLTTIQTAERVAVEAVAITTQLCTTCQVPFPASELGSSPHRQSCDRYCASCLVQLDVALSRELTKRNLRSARERASGDLTDAQWAAILEHFTDRCAYCSFMHWQVIDHAVPTWLGGRTDVVNCVPICYGCSARKGRRTLKELLAEPGDFDLLQLRSVRDWLINCGRALGRAL